MRLNRDLSPQFKSESQRWMLTGAASYFEGSS